MPARLAVITHLPAHLRSGKRKPYWTVAPAVVLLLVLTVWPVIYLVWLSLHETNVLTGLQSFAGMKQYAALLRDPSFVNSVVVTAIFVAVASTTELVLGLVFALLLDSDTRFISGARSLFLLPVFISPVAAALTWGLLFQGNGIVNYALHILGIAPQAFIASPHLAMVSLIVADVWQWTPFMMLMSLAALRGVPVELKEAAAVDGASRLQTMARVVIPMIRPVIAIAFLIRLLDALKVFGLALTLTGGGPGDSTNVLGLFIFNTAFLNNQTSYAAVAAVLFIGASLVISAVYAKALFRRQR